MTLQYDTIDWSTLAPNVAHVFPHTDIDALTALGDDGDAGLRHIASSQDLTVEEAEEMLADRVLVQQMPAFQVAAE